MAWTDPVSESQVSLMQRLAAERRTALVAAGKWPNDISTVQEWMVAEAVWGTDQSAATLDRAGAKVVIDQLFAITDTDDPDGYQGPDDVDRIIANRYAQACCVCGQSVDEQAGYSSLLTTTGKWVSSHRDGDCGEAPASVGVNLDLLRPFLTATGHGNETAFFAHPDHSDGPDDDQTRQRIKVVLREKSGWMSVYCANIYAGGKAGFGTDFGAQRPGSGQFIPSKNCQPKHLAVIAAVAADGAAALRSYGFLTGTCAICRKSLTSDGTNTNGWNSVSEGIGEVCATKVGLR